MRFHPAPRIVFAMHPDVAKLVEMGKIPEAVGERLTQLSPGNFCVHKSFGAGKIIEWDLPAKRVTIDFEKASGKTMELQFAFQKTEWIPVDDFRARKIEGVDTLRELAKKDPVELVVHLIRSHGGSLTGEALETELAGSVIPEKGFKKWWDTTKKQLRESRRALVPQKRVEPITLRDMEQSPASALMIDFDDSRDVKGMIRALEAIAADIGAFSEDVEPLRKILSEIDEAARKASRVQLGQALQLVAARDEVLASKSELILDDSSLRLSDLLALADIDKLTEETGGLPSARQRAVYEAFPVAFGEEWVDKIVQVFDKVSARGVTEIARILSEQSKLPSLMEHLRSAIARRALNADALIWVCRERNEAAEEIFSGDVGAAILNLLENDHLADGPRKTSRLQSLLGDDKTLLNDLVEAMDVNEARNFARRLLDCPVFGELEKKSLMARIIRTRPETGDLVSGNNDSREEALLVSWESLERKKAELDDIVRNRIPQNTKDISVARSYGDLRENFEYKSAKDMQKFLMHRKSELEREIHRARGTDFRSADAAKVNIGTIVTLQDSNGDIEEMTVLGAWDSEPEKKVVSYLSEVGKALVGREAGETIEVRDLVTEEPRTLTIRSIRPFHP